jgi:hypothetical protein
MSVFKKGTNMKKTISILMVVGILLFSYQSVFAAAGTWSAVTYGDTETAKIGNIKSFTLTFTASSDNATIPNYTISAAAAPTLMNYIRGFFLYAVETKPGTTGPTNGVWDIAVNDVHGLDILGGQGANRSSTLTQVIMPYYFQTSAGFPPMDGTTWTIAISGNAVNSATCTIKFILVK